jgi:6-phosphogluconolactonase (cycloisomerase 2 family)
MNQVSGKDVFVGYATSGKGLFTLDAEVKKVQTFPIGEGNQFGGDVCQITATPDSRFVLVGIPSTSSFCTFAFDKTKITLSLQKRILVDGFRTFDMDRYATQLVFLNSKCRQLDLYALKWDMEFKG